MEAYLNSLNNTKSQFNETKKLDELTTDNKYPVQTFKTAKTKYGTSKIVTLIDENNNQSFTPETQSRSIDVFLPNRFNEVEFDEDKYKHYLIYHGKKLMKDGKQFHDVQFELEAIPNYNPGVNYNN